MQTKSAVLVVIVVVLVNIQSLRLLIDIKNSITPIEVEVNDELLLQADFIKGAEDERV